nr:kinesin-like protein KIN-4A [Tanacetum cinerariifolium]
MENSPENCNVKVALHIRPLLRHERQNGGQECLDVVPGSAQVLMGSHSFIFDHVYGAGGSPSDKMFEECAVPLLDALFQGYNGTVIAYGQTGSGKTYTMGTNPKESSHRGLIIQVMHTIFKKIETLKDQSEFQLHVSFIEILKEEVRDLLDSAVIERKETSDGNAEIAGKNVLQIRKASDGAISLSGSTEVSVSTQKEMTSCLEQGCLNRSVASTDMNNQSSRSHAIFTIILEQKDKNKAEANTSELMGEEFRCAKLHLVDLAGSERAKRAGSEGVRLKEGIQINKGLLALGNVISALGDEKKRKEGNHIPYRDSKLTRLLQASLGGNCKTVMIASVQKEVFPADTHKLRQQLRLLQAELAHRKEAEIVEMQDLKRKIDCLEATKSEIAQRNDAVLVEVQDLKRKNNRLEATNSELVQKIHEYRKRHAIMNPSDIDSNEDKRGSQCTTFPEAMESVPTGDTVASIVKEPDKMTIQPEHEIRQNTLHEEMDDLGRSLEQKESEMKVVGSPDVEALKEIFGQKIIALEEENRSLQLERDGLRHKIAQLEAYGNPTIKDQTMNAERPEDTEADLERKHEHEIEVLKQKNHDAMKKLQDQMRIIKSQKVQLQQKVKQEEEQFRQWKANHEKQLMQVKKDSRKNEFELNKLNALYQRQTQVLQRKTEEAARATKKLKELLESRKVNAQKESRNQPKGQSRSGQIKTLRNWLSQEVEKVVNVHKLRMDHEKKTQSLAKLKEELSYLKQLERSASQGSRQKLPDDNGGSRGPSLSSHARAARIVSLESRVKSSTAALSAISSQVQEAGRGHDPKSVGRWKTLHALGDAKDLLQHLFSIAIEARDIDVSTQPASIQNINVTTLKKKWKEIEEKVMQTTRGKTSSKKSKETEGQAQKGKAPIDIFAELGLGSPLPFPASRELDSKAGICNRPLQTVFKQTQKVGEVPWFLPLPLKPYQPFVMTFSPT